MATEAALYRLMSWLSPSFPVGAYSYSHGLEYAVEAGLVRDRETLTQWVTGIVERGSGRMEADLFRAAYGADDEALEDVARMAEAARGTAEQAVEGRNQGEAFIKAVLATWSHPSLEAKASRIGSAPAYSVAVAVTASAFEVPLGCALAAYLHAFASNLISAAVRLVPLGQTDGQKAVASMEPVVALAVQNSLARGPEDFGSATPMVDWTSMNHETQYTRLFRS